MVTSKCLAILYLPMTSPTSLPISAAPVQPAGGDAGGDGGEELLGGGQEVLALAGALAGQGGVAAGDQPLAGEVGLVISARSCSSNRRSCSGPSSAMSLRMAGARSAVIHA